MRKLRQRSSKPRTSQLGSDACRYESHRNVRVSISMLVLACSFLVHVVQSVLQWGKDPMVVVKEKGVANTKRREERISSP